MIFIKGLHKGPKAENMKFDFLHSTTGALKTDRYAKDN
jgi:hypothetical protein